MALSVIARTVHDVVILDVSGRLTAGAPTTRLRNTLHRCVDEGTRNFVLDMGNVSEIDEAGIEELATIFGWLRIRNRRIGLLNVNAAARSVLQTANLLALFEMFDNERHAVRSLADRRATG